ncbi:hypothetical protein BGZ94_004461, partial [Podila epigama]
MQQQQQQHPLFEDFLDMDLLGPSAENSDIFSYFLDPVESGDMDLTDVATALVASPTMSNASMASPLDMALPIKFEDDDDDNIAARKLMLMDIDSSPVPDCNLNVVKSEQKEPTLGAIAVQASDDMMALTFGDDTRHLSSSHLVTPAQLSIAPQATVIAPATAPTPSSTSITAVSTSAAAPSFT